MSRKYVTMKVTPVALKHLRKIAAITGDKQYKIVESVFADACRKAEEADQDFELKPTYQDETAHN